MAKPVLKWAGGKRQLLPIIDENLPLNLKNNSINTYVEPFIGGGAVFFHLAKNYNIKRAYLSDVNPELILLYTVIKKNVKELIIELNTLAKEYFDCKLEEDKKEYFLSKRKKFNKDLVNFDYSILNENSFIRVAELIFMNRTCFNGLFRVNKKGEFNVPFGRYKNPKIIDEENLLKVSDLLQIATIKLSSYRDIPSKYLDNSFIYLDPPYRPLNLTSSFTSYSKYDFNDTHQIELSDFIKKISKNNFILLSNSDPKNTDSNDNFFDDLYKDFNIMRVSANRMINSKGSDRKKITELLIKNYKE